MGRAPCCDKTNVKRGPWSPEEDATLRNYLERHHGTAGTWIALPPKAGLRRCGKSCRLRWLNYLRPDIKHGCFTPQEDNIICTLYNNIGSRWSVIASHLPGRTDNDVKNYWNTKLKKKLRLLVHGHFTTTTTTQEESSTAPTTLPPPLPPLPKVETDQAASSLYSSSSSTPDLFSAAVATAAMGMDFSSYDQFLSAPFPIMQSTTTSMIQLPPQTADDQSAVNTNWQQLANHVLVSPPEDGYSSPSPSSTISSAGHNWSANNVTTTIAAGTAGAAGDLFLQEFGFGSYGEQFLAAGFGEVAPLIYYSSNSSTN